MQRKFKAGILGATGAVGQKFIEVLTNHPWFEISVLAASERSAGKKYRDAVNWIGSKPIPTEVADLEVVEAKPGFDADVVFSGLDANVAEEIERDFAAAGYPVVSNARNYRMKDDVPLLIPEVNPDHTKLIERQSWGSSGYIVTNPNCSTVGLVTALRPLVDAFGVEVVQVVTMQALSGAGYPGVASLDALGNVVPYIGGEEEKMQTEPLKLLGKLEDGRVSPASIAISAHCNRVPVLEGHTEAVSVKLGQKVDAADVREVFKNYRSPIADLGLPSAPDPLFEIFDDQRWHVELGNGMKVSIGRIRNCPVFDVKFVLLVHNTIRGAAGGAVLNAELLVKQGYLVHRETTVAVGA